ncbi:MAG: class I mannose-6-phosphate isomerase [Anaerolineae bacterium]|nr:class I mannose-6-phosphate isomerase [Anaerolineae bacterium]
MLTPTLHVKVWGGRKLETEIGKDLPSDEPYGEAWELHDSSTIANGEYRGRTVSELITEQGSAIIGAGFDPSEGMPLLIKFLDASAWLSVQVHPNDEQARQLEGDPRGKTEAWMMLATDTDAKLVIGVQSGTSRAAMAEAIRTGTLEDLLVYATVQPNDVLYLPANTIHAVGPGILLYEVQQSSNMTYRLYDWNRLGLDGKPRELHIEKGVQVSNVEALPDITHPTGELIVDGDYFQTLRHQLKDDSLAFNTDGHFHALTCIAGKVRIEHNVQSCDMNKGQTALVPAALGAYVLSGNGTVLRSWMA